MNEPRDPRRDEDPEEPYGETPGGDDPLAGLFEALAQGGGLPEGLTGIPGLPADPAMLQAMVAQVQQLMAAAGDGPVDWDLARQVARQTAAAGGDPSVSPGQVRQVEESLRTADLWLDQVTTLPAAATKPGTWSRAEWIEHTLGTWKGVVEPVALRVGDALSESMAGQAPPEMRALLGNALPMIRKMGGAFFGAQVGQALGTLAREVLGGGDVGLPLLDRGRAALVPANVAAFGEGLGLPNEEVQLYLALREAAHARLFAGVAWLRSHLLAAVEDYARGIAIDTDKISEAVQQIDPTDPEALKEGLSSGLFEPERTPAQQAALNRLETALALVEGWVDHVVDSAAAGTLPHRDALREAVRRRRAVGGPAEHVFATLVGLELRPRRLREAAAVWSAVARVRGQDGRDALWSHPDLVPDEAAFSDPEKFADNGPESSPLRDDLDEQLAKLLDEAEHSASDDQPDERPDVQPDERPDGKPDDQRGDRG